jgi:hypothetical protein
MFDPTSRYAKLAVKTLPATGPDGPARELRYVERRFLPAAGAGPALVQHRVVQGERLDRLTAKYLGDPAQFWRVADANTTLRPEELTDQIGGTITIALPQP